MPGIKQKIIIPKKTTPKYITKKDRPRKELFLSFFFDKILRSFAPCNIPKESIHNPEIIFCMLSEQKSEKTTHKRVKICLDIIFLGIVNEEVKVFNRKYSLKIK